MAPLRTLCDTKNSEHLILSPKVGFFSPEHKAGTFLSPGAFVGRIRALNSYQDLYLPEDVQGKVVLDENMDKTFPVEYGQELFRLRLEQLVDDEKKFAADESKAKETADADEGYVISAFTTGIFYRKPAPDAPPFVEVGQRIEKGKALGLIEVMKTFNRIIFHGTDKAEVGKIKKVYVEDAAEVKSGQPLFLID